MTTDTDTILSWRGEKLFDREGDKLGTIDEIYIDDETGRPEWALVNTGLFGSKSTFVPLREATKQSDQVRVPYEKSLVKDAPNMDADGHLTPEEEQNLYRHYSLDAGVGRQGDVGDTERGTVGRDTSGPTTDDAMTRSEEELRVGTTQRATGKARLRKHVVTEHVQTTVPVQREEVRVEREPITDANADDAMDGPALSDEEHEVTLHEEEVVVDKRAVPKERVRLDKDTVTDEQTVDEDVRKEEIEIDDAEAASRRR